jgi:hypothetical protein
MINAKIMLTTLSIVAIIALSFALKIKKRNTHILYTGPLHSGICTTRVAGNVIITGTPQCAASTTSLLSGCPDGCIMEVSN